jgi:general secretion pathway protein J
MTNNPQHRAVLRRDADGGFTLIEMLVAIALMGLVLSALATITAQWVPNWHRGFARVQRNEMLDIALSRLATDLGAAEFVTTNRKAAKPLFDGAELSVTFVRSALGPNARPSLEVVRISQIADRLGPLLVRSRAPFAPTDPEAPKSLPVIFTDQVALLRGPYQVSFAYADRDGIWRDKWLDENEMPASVRFTIRDAASERSLAVSTAAIVRVDVPAECANPKSKRECGTLTGGPPDEGQVGGPNPKRAAPAGG